MLLYKYCLDLKINNFYHLGKTLTGPFNSQRFRKQIYDAVCGNCLNGNHNDRNVCKVLLLLLSHLFCKVTPIQFNTIQ